MSQTKAQLVSPVGILTASEVVVAGIVTANNGGINVIGIVTATSFSGNGSGLIGVGIGSTGSINTSGILTASTFIGNLSDSVITNYTEKVSNLGNTGTSKTINLVDGNVFTATLNDNCTFTFNTGISTGAASFTLILTNDAIAGRSIIWPVSVKWPNNVTPVRTTTANASDIWSFFTPNNGATWYGNIALYNFTL